MSDRNGPTDLKTARPGEARPHFCGKCGQPHGEGVRFCGRCGHATTFVAEGAGAAPAAQLANRDVDTAPLTAETAPLTAETAAPPQREVSHTTVTPTVAKSPAPLAGGTTPLGSSFDGSAAGPDMSGSDHTPEKEVTTRRKWVFIVGGIAAVAVAGAVLAVALTGHNGKPTPAAHQVQNAGHTLAPPSQLTPPITASSETTPTTSAQTSELAAANSLSSLLAVSVTDRSSIQNAVSDVMGCGPNLTQDQQTFTTAVGSRESLLSRLASLNGVNSLPAPMIQALTSAWQASMQADQDFASWAGDEVSQGCTANDTSDPNFQASSTPDDQATSSKMAFASLWNPIATEDGLTTYQWNQL